MLTRLGGGADAFPTPAASGQLNNRIYWGMDEQLELEADIQQEMAASGDFVEGRDRLRREAPGPSSPAREPGCWPSRDRIARLCVRGVR